MMKIFVSPLSPPAAVIIWMMMLIFFPPSSPPALVGIRTMKIFVPPFPSRRRDNPVDEDFRSASFSSSSRDNPDDADFLSTLFSDDENSRSAPFPSGRRGNPVDKDFLSAPFRSSGNPWRRGNPAYQEIRGTNWVYNADLVKEKFKVHEYSLRIKIQGLSNGSIERFYVGKELHGFKEGVIDDFFFGKRIKLGYPQNPYAQHLKFYSTQNPFWMISLETYVSRMKKEQDCIFCIAGETQESVEKSPLMERILKYNYDVLFLVNDDDEKLIEFLKEFDGKKMVSVNKEGLKVEKSDHKMKKEEGFEGVFKAIKDILGDKVTKVVVSHRLVQSPCCLVSGRYGFSANMLRMEKSSKGPRFRGCIGKILEINTLSMFLLRN